MEIRRDKYLDLLIHSCGNGLIKVITGMRRCGKSYLLFTPTRPRTPFIVFSTFNL